MLDFKIQDARFNVVRVEWKLFIRLARNKRGLSSIQHPASFHQRQKISIVRKHGYI